MTLIKQQKCPVITFIDFNLRYAGVALHSLSSSILRRLASSEQFGGQFCSGGAEIPRSFSFFFFSFRVMTLGLKSVSFTLVCLFLSRVSLCSVNREFKKLRRQL